MSCFLQEFSPGKTVRVAAELPDGTYANSYPGKAPIAAIDHTRPVAMYLTGRRYLFKDRQPRYFPVPFEFDPKGADIGDVTQQVADLTELLDRHGVPWVLARSGPTGGMHVWTYCPRGVERETVADLGQFLHDLYPALDPSCLSPEDNGILRPPGALHRSGHGHSTLAGATLEEAVAVLRRGALPGAYRALLSTVRGMVNAPGLSGHKRRTRPQRFGDRRVPPSIAGMGPVRRPVEDDATGAPRVVTPPRLLGKAARACLARRPVDAPGVHSTAFHAAARACAAAGWSYDEFVALIEDEEASPALEWLRTRSTTTGGRVRLDTREAARRRERAWHLATQAAARLKPRHVEPDADEELPEGAYAAADVVARLESLPAHYWSRMSGPATLETGYAVAYQMTLCGDAPAAPVRRMAVLAGRSPSTAAEALRRLSLDGLLTLDPGAPRGRAGRVRLATSHVCSEDPAHRCCSPVTNPEASESPVQSGSDRSETPAPPGGGARLSVVPAVSPLPRRDRQEVLSLLNRLRRRVEAQQAGVWHTLGHHALRTYLGAVAGEPLDKLIETTHYSRSTVVRHVALLQGLGLLQGNAEGRYSTGARTLWEAGMAVGSATKAAERAVRSIVDQAVHQWWDAELRWCRAKRGEKARQDERLPAEAELIWWQDPEERRYPRLPHPRPRHPGDHPTGAADHARAWEIEAQRLNAGALLVRACELAREGRIIDPADLRDAVSPPTLQQPQAA